MSLLWDFIIDELLIILNNKGYYTQGYAEHNATLIVRKVQALFLKSSDIKEGWSGQENRRVNPAKATLVPFLTRRKLVGLKPRTLQNETV